MGDEVQGPLPYIQETILKKRKSSEEWAIRRRQQLEERKWKIKANKQLTFKRAEQYIKEFRGKELDLARMKYRARKFSAAPGKLKSQLLFVIRIQGKFEVHSVTKKILYSLGLGKLFTGVFLEANEGNLAKLQRVEPYVTYGSSIRSLIFASYFIRYPNFKNVRDLIFKKGIARINQEKVPLTNNLIIEQELGKYDIISIEDIVHQIATVGPHFKEVTKFLCPFNLSKPTSGLRGIKNRFKDGGDSGNREEKLNELIDKMN
ncbi:Large ribosomal subunit protein uL30z-like protein [Drosera capensis]